MPTTPTDGCPTCTAKCVLEGVDVGIAQTLARVIGGDVAWRVFDGSAAGPADAVATIELRSPRALSYVASATSDLGLGRAYVTGEMEVHGDLYTAMAHLARLDLEMSIGERVRLLRELGGASLLLRRPPR